MKIQLKYILLLIAVIYNYTTAKCNSSPFSNTYPLKNSFQKITLQSFNNDSLIKKDKECSACGKHFGIGIKTDINMLTNGEWEILPDSSKVWRLAIKSDNAVGLRLIGDNFKMPEGGKLYVYNKDKTIINGPIQSTGKEKFSTSYIGSNEVILEYNAPASVNILPELNIYEIVYIYNSMIPIPMSRSEYQQSEPCHTNVNCAPWEIDNCREIRSVVKYTYKEDYEGERWSFCSGVLINSTPNINYAVNGFTPYILTANHCVKFGIQHSDWLVYFNWQSPTCPDAIGNDNMYLKGVQMLVGDGHPFCPTDIALMRTYEAPPLHYNVWYAGWNRTTLHEYLPNTHVRIISHPAGDVKKILNGTVETYGYRDASYPDQREWRGQTNCDGYWWKIDPNNDFVEGGSSGAPIFNNENVIGLVSGSLNENDQCGDDQEIRGSILGSKWNLFKQYLASGSEDDLWAIGGIDPIEVCQPNVIITREHYPASSWQTQNLITIQAQNTIIAQQSSTIYPDNGRTWISNFEGRKAEYLYRAGNSIKLMPGFGVQTGASFRGYIEQNPALLCVGYGGSCGYNYLSKMAPPTDDDGLIINDLPDHASLSEDEQPISKFNIYPNPVSDILTLNFKIETATFVKIQLLTLEGKLKKTLIEKHRYNEGLHNIQVNVSDLPSGLYIVKYVTKAGTEEIKLLKL